MSANSFALTMSRAFLADRARLIQLDPDTHELKADAATLRSVGQWFNSVHPWVSMLTGNPMAPVAFRLDGSAADRVTLLHVSATTQQAANVIQARLRA